MAAIPTLEAQDARRPGREREAPVGERTRLINRMKSALARLGIRNFKPNLRKASERLSGLLTPKEAALPPNTLAELRRDVARLQMVKEQINQIERTRLERLQQPPADAPHAMLILLARVYGVGLEPAEMLVHEVLVRNLCEPSGGGALRRDHRGARRERRA
jgi:transposase